MKCEVCGKEFEKRHYGEPYNNICSSECFEKKIWIDRIKDKDDPHSVIIDHVAYWIGNENDKSYFRGFGGRKFKIQFNDGRYVESTNLWHNGDILEEFWNELPDNATFIKDKQESLLNF